MNCPICNGKIERNAVLVCQACWWLIPTFERVGLARLYPKARALKDPAKALELLRPKVEKIKKIVWDKHPHLIPNPDDVKKLVALKL